MAGCASNINTNGEYFNSVYFYLIVQKFSLQGSACGIVGAGFQVQRFRSSIVRWYPASCHWLLASCSWSNQRQAARCQRLNTRILKYEQRINYFWFDSDLNHPPARFAPVFADLLLRPAANFWEREFLHNGAACPFS